MSKLSWKSHASAVHFSMPKIAYIPYVKRCHLLLLRMNNIAAYQIRLNQTTNSKVLASTKNHYDFLDDRIWILIQAEKIIKKILPGAVEQEAS